ncbi:Uncharacterised protein [uncultured archaeon]|nr:Uncharacterised protein [uncultured archaeon]
MGSGIWSSLIVNNAEGWSYGTLYHYFDDYYSIETALFPIKPLSDDLAGSINSPDPNNRCGYGAPYRSYGYTAITHAFMSGSYTFNIITDDGTQIFYRQGSGSWSNVYPAWPGSQSPCGSPNNPGYSWCSQSPNYYTRTISFPAGIYEIAVEYIDTCDPAGLSVVQITPPPGLPG